MSLLYKIDLNLSVFFQFYHYGIAEREIQVYSMWTIKHQITCAPDGIDAENVYIL